MTTDIVARLREPSNWMKEGRANEDWKNLQAVYDRAPFEAADHIEALEAEVAKLRGALESRQRVLRELLQAVMAEEMIYTGAITETLEASGMYPELTAKILAALGDA